MLRSFIYIALSFTITTSLAAQSDGGEMERKFFLYINTNDAVTYGYADLVYDEIRSYLKQGLNINAQDDAGNTAFHIAANNGNKALVIALAQFRPNPRIRNSYGKTPLDIVSEKETMSRILGAEEAEAWKELLSFFQQYERDYHIKNAVEYLRAGDMVSDLEQKLYNMDKFISSIKTLDDVMATNYLYETSKGSMIMQIKVTDMSLMSFLDDIDARWQKKVNQLIMVELNNIESSMFGTMDKKAFLRGEQRLTDINNLAFLGLSEPNEQKLARLYSICCTKAYELEGILSKVDAERRLNMLLSIKDTGDDLIDRALDFIMEGNKEMDSYRLVILITVIELISFEDYNGKYKFPSFIKSLASIRDLYKTNNYDPAALNKALYTEMMKKAKFQVEMIRETHLRLN